MIKEDTKIMNHLPRIETGYTCSMVINTRGKKIPLYLLDYLKQVVVDTNYAFDIRALVEVTDQIDEWREACENPIKNSDTLIQIICTLNVEVDSNDFQSYMQDIINENITPFILGCNFDTLGIFFRMLIPDKYLGLAVEGTGNITIYSENTDEDLLKQVFVDVFGMTELRADDNIGYLRLAGYMTLENCIMPDKKELIEEVLEINNIKYTICID